MSELTMTEQFAALWEKYGDLAFNIKVTRHGKFWHLPTPVTMHATKDEAVAVAYAAMLRSEQATPATPAIDPARVIAAYNDMADLQLAVYVDGVKVHEPEPYDAGGALECLRGLGIECRELEVWHDGPLPDALDELMAADARIRRWEWDEDNYRYRDPADGSLWDAEGGRIEEENANG